MEPPDIRKVLGLLQEAGIPVCIVGELALNYYNAPRVIHVSPPPPKCIELSYAPAYPTPYDLDLCVPADDIESAKAIFGSQTDLFIRADETDYNIYTKYKRGFPRFRFRPGRGSCIVLFTDKYHHLDPLSEHIVPREEHQNAGEYSREILDSVSADQIAALPLPRFTPFFKGLCRKYIETQEATAAIAAELLVDGMDLSEEWCQLYFYASESDELAFALRLISGKSSWIDDFSSNQVTCFIAEREEAQRIQKTPGFCVAATKQEAN